MKKLLIFLAAAALIAGCKKADLAGNDPTGEGLVGFALKTPSSGTAVVLNAATPNATVNFTWGASTPGLHTAPTYKWVATTRIGTLENPLITFPAGNNGTATSLNITYKQLDSLLKAAGIADGAKTDMIWGVQADNGSTKLLAQNSFNITITRFKDGATPFSILGPSSSTSVISINPGSTTDSLKFNWTKSAPASVATGLKYRVYFYKDDAASTLLFSMNSNRAGADSLLSVSYKDFSDSLTAHGLTDPSAVAALKWNVAAVSGTWSQYSDFTNQIYIARLVRMYFVGSMTGWDINAPVELIADKNGGRLGKVFYTYIKLNAGDEFKFVRTPGDWGSAYGNNGASGIGYNTGFNQGGNFQISAAGVYRITIDLGANMAYVQQKKVGLVGSLQSPSQWDPPSVVTGGIVSRNKFLIISNASATDEFKFHDGTAWDNSSPGLARWWGKGSGTGNLDNDGNGANLTNPGTGRLRAIWDGTDPQQVKYDLSPATEMRIVGDGLQGVNAWDPGSSPQMTYLGNGKWQLTLALIGNKEFKFVAGNAWGAFDYEDNSGGSQATGTPRPIKWDGGGNFKTPAASGTYTIILDEYNQTATIN